VLRLSIARKLPFALMLVLATGGGTASGADKVNLDDRDVIQTALLSFSHREWWHSRDWKTTKYVVLRPQYIAMSRDFFTQLLQARIDALKADIALEKKPPTNPSSVKRDGAYLAGLVSLKLTSQRAGKYVAPAVRSLESYQWDKRIVLTYNGSTVEPADPRRRLDKKYGKVGVFAAVSLPVYSPNGDACILNMRMPWSSHSSDTTFVLKRTKGKWTVVFGGAAFHV
jgi:hypothetical protein